MLVPEYLAAPNTADATRVLILGECSLAVSLANAFESAGAFVSMVGETSNVDDINELRKVVEHFQPHFVVPASDEVSIATLQQLQAEVSVEIVPSSKFLERAYDREHIYKIAADELGLPTPMHGCASSIEEAQKIAATLGYPCVARSVENTGEGASYILQHNAAVSVAWEKLQAPRIILERLVDYDYAMTILAVRSIDPNTGKLATWFCQPIGKVLEHGQLAASFQPLILEQVALDNAHSMVARITNAIGGRGIFAVDLFVAGEDVYFSGLSAHPNHSGTVTMVTQRLSQAELLARAVLGLPVDVTLTSPGAVRFAELGDKKLPHNLVAKALAIPETQVFFTRNGYCALAVTADTATEAYQRAEQAFSALEVSDTAQAAELAVMPSGAESAAPQIADAEAAASEVAVAEVASALNDAAVTEVPAASSVLGGSEAKVADGALELNSVEESADFAAENGKELADPEALSAQGSAILEESEEFAEISSETPVQRSELFTDNIILSTEDGALSAPESSVLELDENPEENTSAETLEPSASEGPLVDPSDITDVVTPPTDPGDVPDESLNNLQRP